MQCIAVRETNIHTDPSVHNNTNLRRRTSPFGPNQSVNSKYNQISVWIKIPVIAVLVGVVLAGVVAAPQVGVGVVALLFGVAGKRLGGGQVR